MSSHRYSVAERVEKDMIEEGINFIPKSVPTKIEKTDGKNCTTILL